MPLDSDIKKIRLLPACSVKCNPEKIRDAEDKKDNIKPA
jgi:predicted DNA-binding protein (MmcQ/YjbR family)